MLTEIWIGNIKISEPITALTDILVAIVCIIGFIGERKSKMKSNTMQLFFLFMFFSTLWGGIIGHAFFYHFSQIWRVPSWYASMIAIGCLERHAIQEIRSHIQSKFLRLFLILNISEILFFIILIGVTLEFKYVELHSVYGILGVVLGFSILNYRKTKSFRSKQLLIVVGLSVLSGLVYNIPIRINEWFNEADLAHCILAISVGLLFRKKGS